MEVPGECEGSHDEAVGVHGLCGDGPEVWVAWLYAGDGHAIGYVLQGGHQEGAGQEDQEGGANFAVAQTAPSVAATVLLTTTAVWAFAWKIKQRKDNDDMTSR